MWTFNTVGKRTNIPRITNGLEVVRCGGRGKRLWEVAPAREGVGSFDTGWRWGWLCMSTLPNVMTKALMVVCRGRCADLLFNLSVLDHGWSPWIMGHKGRSWQSVSRSWSGPLCLRGNTNHMHGSIVIGDTTGGCFSSCWMVLLLLMVMVGRMRVLVLRGVVTTWPLLESGQILMSWARLELGCVLFMLVGRGLVGKLGSMLTRGVSCRLVWQLVMVVVSMVVVVVVMVGMVLGLMNERHRYALGRQHMWRVWLFQRRHNTGSTSAVSNYITVLGYDHDNVRLTLHDRYILHWSIVVVDLDTVMARGSVLLGFNPPSSKLLWFLGEVIGGVLGEDVLLNAGIVVVDTRDVILVHHRILIG